MSETILSVSPTILSILPGSRISIVGASDALLLFVMTSQRLVLLSALGSRAVNRLKIWPHNGFYLRLLKILYVTFYRGTRRSLVELLVKFSVSFFVWFWTFLCLSQRQVFGSFITFFLSLFHLVFSIALSWCRCLIPLNLQVIIRCWGYIGGWEGG